MRLKLENRNSVDKLRQADNSTLNRRTMLLGSAAAWMTIGPLRRATADEPKALIHETKVISHQQHYFHGWPTIARRKNGELLLVYSGGRDQHICPFGRIEMMRSHDDGKTWGWPRVLLDMEIDVRDAGIMETDKGTLLVNTFTSEAYLKRLQSEIEKANAGKKGDWSVKHLTQWRAAHERISDEQRKKLLGSWMIRSTDDGLTWSAPYDCLVDSPHGPIQLADGRQLYAGKDMCRSDRIGVCESTDDGKTWRWLAEIPARPGDDALKSYHELHAVEAADGRIIAHIRNHSGEVRNPRPHDYCEKQKYRDTLQTESSDGGKTWSEPHSIGVSGYPSHLLRIKDDRLLMTYGVRFAPFGNQARISHDNGRTWSEPIVISSDGSNTDLGYPSTVQLADGSLLTIWYEKMKNYARAVLRQTHWLLK